MNDAPLESEPIEERPAKSGKRRRADGVWLDTRTPGKPVLTIRYKGIDGKMHREGTVATTREEARALRRRRLSEIARAQSLGLKSVGALSPMTFRTFSAEFLSQSKVSNAARTYQRYCESVERLLPTFGAMTLPTISGGDVEMYMVERRKTPVHRKGCDKGAKCKCTSPAPATVNHERAVLSGIFNMAMRRGLIDRNPIPMVKPLKVNNTRDRYLEREEEVRLLAASPSWLKPILVIGLNTGMRLGEILAMRRSDVDFARKMLRVPKTKNGQVRHVPLNTVAMLVIENVPKRLGPDGVPPALFVNRMGKPYKRYSVAHAFKRAAGDAGIATTGEDRVTFHTLRHTAVSRLVAAGVPDRKIMKFVGHSTPGMVSRYAHLSPDGLRDAADTLAAPVSSTKRTRSVQTVARRKKAR